MTAETSEGPVGTFLIMLRHVVVAQDIALTLEDVNPDAEVIIVTTQADALATLATVGTVAIAFVQDGPVSFAQSALAQAIAQRGGRVVLIGTEAEDHGEAAGWHVLHRPFSSDAVRALLKPLSA